MQTYGNPKNPRIQSQAGLSATMLQTELFGFGVQLTGSENHYELTRLITSHGAESVRAVAMKALNRYTEGVDGTADKSAEGYIMEKLNHHNWNRNNHNF